MGSSHSKPRRFVPAVERMPTELWQSILLSAIESPLLPRTGDDFVDGLMVFSSGCQSQYHYRKVEIVRTRLRLVCRSWNAFLQDVAAHRSFFSCVKLLRIPIRGEGTQNIRRVELADNCILNTCYCLERQPIPRDMKIYGKDATTQTKRVEYLQLPSLYSQNHRYEVIMDILNSATRLRALAFGPNDSFRQKFILNHTSLKHITHLSVGLFGTYSDGPRTQPFSFPAVRVLFIQIGDYRPREDILLWRFPSVTSLYIKRGTHSYGGHLLEGLDLFLAAYGRQITSLYIECKCRRNAVDALFWDWFPNVHLFGIELTAFESTCTPPPASNGLTSLAVRGIKPYCRVDWPRLERCIDPLLKVCREWGIGRLIILTSWDELASVSAMKSKTTTFYYCSTVWAKRLFHEGIESGLQICDVERVPITAPEGVRFLQKLVELSTLPGGELEWLLPKLPSAVDTTSNI